MGIPTATKDAPGGDPRAFSSFILQLTVDDDEVDARRKLIGLDVSGVVDDRCGIENGDVREKPGCNRPRRSRCSR